MNSITNKCRVFQKCFDKLASTKTGDNQTEIIATKDEVETSSLFSGIAQEFAQSSTVREEDFSAKSLLYAWDPKKFVRNQNSKIDCHHIFVMSQYYTFLEEDLKNCSQLYRDVVETFAKKLSLLPNSIHRFVHNYQKIYMSPHSHNVKDRKVLITRHPTLSYNDISDIAASTS